MKHKITFNYFSSKEDDNDEIEEKEIKKRWSKENAVLSSKNKI